MGEQYAGPGADVWGRLPAHVAELQDVSASIERVKAEGDPAALTAALENVGHIRDALKVIAEYARAVDDAIRARMVEVMGHGEVSMAPSGRFAYIDKVSDGRASVRPDAVDEHAGELPPDLRPREVLTVKRPGVTELQRAARHGDIPWELYRLLVDEPPRVLGVRWRTMWIGAERDRLSVYRAER